jgi:hypothetical protein
MKGGRDQLRWSTVPVADPAVVVARVVGVLAVFVGLADRGGPVLLAVDLGEDLGGQVVGAAVEHHAAGLQADDAAHELLGQRDVVNVNDRRQAAFVADLHDEPHDLPRGLRIERGRRLVDQQQVGVLLQGAGDADTLALTAGQGVGALVHMVGQPDTVEQPVGVLDRLRGELAEEAAPESDIAEPPREHVLHHGEAFHQGVFLEDHADPPPGPAQSAAAQAGDLHVAQEHGAGGRLDQPVDAADQRGLSGAGRPDQANDLTGLDR